jgi:hypothetical protein
MRPAVMLAMALTLGVVPMAAQEPLGAVAPDPSAPRAAPIPPPPVSTPDDPSHPNRALVEEGWIRWREDAMGPWVWWCTRGC